MRLPLSIATAAAGFLLATSSRADDAANTASARALGIEGVTLADAGNCALAIEKLERAEKLHHAPTTAGRLGECEIERGHLVAGTEILQRIVREPLPPNAHPAFGAAVTRAQKVLDKTLPRVATLRLSVKAPPNAKITVTIDGEAVPDAVVDGIRRIDPGEHAVEVTAPGFFPASETTRLEDGQTKSVAFELRADPNAPPPAAETRDGGLRSSTAAPEARGGSKVPAVVAFGLGAVGLGLGIYGGLTVANKSSDLNGACDANRVCPTGSRADIDSAKSWATISTVGFIAAGAGLLTGTVLLFTSSGSASTSPQQGVRVRPSVGAASVGLNGVF